MSGYDFESEGYCPFCETETSHRCHCEGHERDSSGDYRYCNVCGASKSEIFSEWVKDGEWRKAE